MIRAFYIIILLLPCLCLKDVSLPYCAPSVQSIASPKCPFCLHHQWVRLGQLKSLPTHDQWPFLGVDCTLRNKERTWKNLALRSCMSTKLLPNEGPNFPAGPV